MKGPSYFQQIAPRRPGRQLGGVAVLPPPRAVFRPGLAIQDTIETESRLVSSAARPMRSLRQMVAATASAMPPIPRDAAGGAVGFPQPAPAAASVSLPAPQPGAAAAADGPRQPGEAPRGVAGDRGAGAIGRATADVRRTSLPEVPAAADRTPPAGRAGRPAIASGPTAAHPPAVAMPAPADVQRNAAAAQRGAAAAPGAPRIGEGERPLAFPRPPAQEADGGRLSTVQPAQAPTPQAPPRHTPRTPAAQADHAAPPPLRVAATAALPVITPPAPPPRPPIPPPARERAATGLHIGTLEVRVVTPAAPPVPATAHPAPRQRASRPAGSGSGRIARGFGVFGLGQS